MDVNAARDELRRMSKRNLFKLLSKERILRCIVGDQACGFFLHYKGFNFCVSEIFGQGCQVERSENLEDRSEEPWEINFLLPIMQGPDTDLAEKGERGVKFRVYCRDNATNSMILVGHVTERRTKERGKNLEDLLVKAVKDYSNCVTNPSTIFLLSSSGENANRSLEDRRVRGAEWKNTHLPVPKYLLSPIYREKRKV